MDKKALNGSFCSTTKYSLSSEQLGWSGIYEFLGWQLWSFSARIA